MAEEWTGIGVKYKADTTDFEKKSKGLVGDLSEQANAFNEIADAAKKVYGVLKDQIGKAVTSFAVQQKAETDAFRVFGEGAQEVIDQAAKLQKMTIFGDEVTIQAANILGQMGLLKNQVVGLMPVLQDLAHFSGQELPQAARMFGNALDTGTLEPLRRLRIAFSETTKKQFESGNQMQRTALLMKALQDKVGGTASALKNAENASVSFDNAVGDVYETVGGLIDTPVRKFFEGLTYVVNLLNDALGELPKILSTIIQGAAGGLKALVSWLKTTEGQFVATGIAVGVLGVAVLGLGTALAGISWSGVVAGLGAMGKAATAAGTAFIKALIPVIAVIGAVAAATFGIVLAIGTVEKHWDDILAEMRFMVQNLRNSVETAKERIGKAFEWIKDKAFEFIQPIIRKFEDLKEVILSLPGVKQAVKVVADIGTSTKGGVETAVDFWTAKGKEASKYLVDAGKDVGSSLKASGKEIVEGFEGVGEETQDLMKRFFKVAGLPRVGKWAQKRMKELQGIFGTWEKEAQEARKKAGKAGKEAAAAIAIVPQIVSEMSMHKGSEGRVTDMFDMIMGPYRDINVGLHDFAAMLGLQGVEVHEALNKFALDLQDTAGFMRDKVLSTVVSQGGGVGGLIGAGIEGGAAGGPIGAIVAIIFELVSKLESVMKSFDVANEGLDMILGALSPIFDSLVGMNQDINKSLGTMLEALQPLFLVFQRIMEVVSTVFGAFIKAINSVITIIMKVLGPALELFAIFIEGIGKVIEGVAWLIGKAFEGFEKVANEIANFFKGLARVRDGFTAAEFKKLEIIKQTNVAMLKELDEKLKTTMTLSNFRGSIRDIMEDLAAAEILQDISSEELGKLLSEAVGLGLSSDSLVTVFEGMFTQLTDAGLTTQEALLRLQDAVDGTSAVQVDAYEDFADAIWEAGKELSGSLGDTDKEFGNLNDTLKEVNASLTNVPAGYKLVQRRIQSIADEMVTAAPGMPEADMMGNAVVGTVSNEAKASSVVTDNSVNMTLENVQVVANNPDEFLEQLQNAQLWQNTLLTGTPEGTAPAPGSV